MKRITKKRKTILTNIIIFIACILLIIPPYINAFDFKMNSKESYGLITNIKPYKSDGKTRYSVTVVYKVDKKIYSETFNYSNNENISINKKEKIIYNTKNPKEVTSERNIKMYFDSIKILFGNFLFCILLIEFLIKIEGKREDKRLNKEFIENYNNDAKITIYFTALSLLACLIVFLVISLELVKNTPLDGIEFFWIFWPIIFVIVGIIQSIFIIKLRTFKEFKDLKYNLFDKRIMVSENEIYFLKDCLINAVNSLRIYYKDIAIVDIKEDAIVIVKKDARINNLFGVYYGRGKKIFEEARDEVFEEIKLRAPHALKELNDETYEMVKKGLIN